MNVIKVNVNFKNRTIYKQGVDLTSGDYNSTKLIFEFDRQDGIKVFEMKDPDGNLVLLTDIVNNEVDLVGKDENGNNASLFKEAGKYIFEISLYDGESKLTSAFDYIPVKEEQVKDGDKIVTAYLPIFDNLINEVQDLINQTNNLDIDIENSVVTITKKDGTKKSENVKGDKGDKGDAGSVKFIIVNELPTEDIDESAIYMKPSTNPQEKNTYDEYIYVNGDWESLGSAKVEVDLTDYVKNTDYADNSKFGVVKTNNNYGIQTENGVLYIRRATEPEIKTRHQWAPITPNNLDLALKIAMCDGKGAEWTEEEKTGAKTRMGIDDIKTTTSENVRIYNLEQGIYKVPANTTIYAGLETQSWLSFTYKVDVYMFVTNNNADKTGKCFIITPIGNTIDGISIRYGVAWEANGQVDSFTPYALVSTNTTQSIYGVKTFTTQPKMTAELAVDDNSTNIPNTSWVKMAIEQALSDRGL